MNDGAKENAMRTEPERLDRARRPDFAGGWDESKHPRDPKGSSEGGEFAPSGGGVAPGNVNPISTLDTRLKIVGAGGSEDQIRSQLVGLPAEHLAELRFVVVSDGSKTLWGGSAHAAEIVGWYRGDEAPEVIYLSKPNFGMAVRLNTVIHEMGHVVEHAMTNAAHAEWEKISKGGKSARISKYARKNEHEHFAEAYRMMVNGPAVLEYQEPAVYGFMQRLFARGSDLVQRKS